MYDIIKNVINSKDYELRDMLYKINKMYIESYITEAQKTELDELARTNANAENSYAPIQEQIDNANARIDSLEDRVAKLENQEGEPSEPSEKDEYPEFVQPTGVHDAYKIGDKITYNNKKYICKLDNCVWDPDTYPAGWQEVVEEVADEETAESTEDGESEVGE